jgi:hypothetical protein
MVRILALLLGVAAAGLVVQTAAHAARHDPAPVSDAVNLLQDQPPASDHAAKPAATHAPQFHGLLAAGEAEVTSRLGAPDIRRAEGKGAMWTYRLPDCALFVFFKHSEAEGLKVSGAASGPRVRGRNPPPVNECLSEALDRRLAEGPKPSK